MIQQPTLPVQQTAVQQQLLQNPQAIPAQPMPEFNAIKININGAAVTAPSQQPQLPVTTEAYAPAAEVGKNVNYLA